MPAPDQTLLLADARSEEGGGRISAPARAQAKVEVATPPTRASTRRVRAQPPARRPARLMDIGPCDSNWGGPAQEPESVQIVSLQVSGWSGQDDGRERNGGRSQEAARLRASFLT